MIGRISGILAEKNPPQILVDVGGVGYEVDVPMSSFYNLPNIGDKVTLLTEFIVREDAQLLFGFLTQDERITFRQLLKVSGVGARTALAVLSGMSVADLAHAVAMQEVGRLTKVPGIGKKTAERLLLELKGKLPNGAGCRGGWFGAAVCAERQWRHSQCADGTGLQRARSLVGHEGPARRCNSK